MTALANSNKMNKGNHTTGPQSRSSSLKEPVRRGNKRSIGSFHGGVHPPFHKEDSNRTPIRNAGIPKQLVIPLLQHIGRAAEPLIAVGDTVAKGQLIAQTDHHELGLQGLSANVHAPTSGTISAIEERTLPHPSGLSGLSIIIETDGADDWQNNRMTPLADFPNLPHETVLERIRDAGIVGLGGAAFPTAVKLASSIGNSASPIHTLIINGAECEPYITCDDRLMQERPREILQGIRILKHLLKPKVCLIGIEDNKPQAIESLTNACLQEDDIEVVSIPTKYPSGGEKQLIEILTGLEVPSGGLPLDVGVVGQNVATAYSIYKAVIEGEPLISRVVSVTGNGILKPGNYDTLIGTPFSHLAQQAGGYSEMAEHLIMGGPMMGFALPDDAIPVVKATNCALFISTTALNEANSQHASLPTMPCIRCGKCMDACPVNLLPQQLYWHVRAKDYEKAREHHLSDCIECGCCSYVCPSHIPLVDYYRYAKSEIKAQKLAQEKADRSRQRHEFLLFRKEREKQEREAKRAAHKAALQEKKSAAGKKQTSSEDTKTDAIKAAMKRAKARKASLSKENMAEANHKQTLDVDKPDAKA